MPGNRRHIEPVLKRLILNMALQPDMDQWSIRRLTGVSERTQSRVRSLERRTGSVVRTPIPMSRPRILTGLEATRLETSLGSSSITSSNHSPLAAHSALCSPEGRVRSNV
jgi:hypothetical protein